jgi:hypothetical protein
MNWILQDLVLAVAAEVLVEARRRISRAAAQPGHAARRARDYEHDDVGLVADRIETAYRQPIACTRRIHPQGRPAFQLCLLHIIN